MHGPAPLFHTPRVISLQSLDQREVGMKHLWSVVSFKTNQCDQYLHCQNTDVDFHTPLVPLYQTFHH